MKSTDLPLSDRDLEILRIGRAGIIPGFQMAIDYLQRELNQLKEELYQTHNTLAARHLAPALELTVAEARRTLDQPKRERDSRGIAAHGYWQRLTPEERSAEMKRRQAVSNMKLHPRDKRHPHHEQWLENVRKAKREEWQKLPAREQKRRIKNMVAGKNKVAPTVTLEKTA